MTYVNVEKLRSAPDIYDVSVKVISQKGTCFVGHKVGDEFIFGRDHKSPAGVCMGAFATLLPHIRGIQRGARYPEFPEPGVIRLACPDSENPIVFEIRAIRG